MSLSIRPLIALALVCALSACQKEAASPTAPVATADSVGSVGIPECDSYLSKYEACLNAKVPDAARAGLQQSLTQMRSAWKTAASGPGKEALAQACTQAHEAAKAMMQQYGCSDF